MTSRPITNSVLTLGTGITTTGPGPWLPNRMDIGYIEGRLSTNNATGSFSVEVTNHPTADAVGSSLKGTTIYTSKGMTATAVPDVDGQTVQCPAKWIRYNVLAISGGGSFDIDVNL